jgi:DnaJ-class molecular chaperone
MERRTFYVALGIPRGEDTEMVRLAYRKVVDRYRLQLEEEHFDDPTLPPLSFSVLRSYCERRHAAVFDPPESAAGEAEVDSFFHGYVPDVLPPKAKRSGKDLYVELRLTKDEAKIGGIFPVHIPVVKPCPACQAAKDEDEEHTLACRLCAGRRRVTEDHLVEVTAPPGVQDGQSARVAMEDVGLGATDLIINVLIG